MYPTAQSSQISACDAGCPPQHCCAVIHVPPPPPCATTCNVSPVHWLLDQGLDPGQQDHGLTGCITKCAGWPGGGCCTRGGGGGYEYTSASCPPPPKKFNTPGGSCMSRAHTVHNLRLSIYICAAFCHTHRRSVVVRCAMMGCLPPHTSMCQRGQQLRQDPRPYRAAARLPAHLGRNLSLSLSLCVCVCDLYLQGNVAIIVLDALGSGKGPWVFYLRGRLCRAVPF